MAPGTAPLPQHAFERVLRFGRFSLDPGRKLLLEDGHAVRLGGRALDLLVALVERAGEVLGRDELFARVWPHTVVEESSLRVHMSMLRKALGEGSDADGPRYIANLPGRGYRFVMEVVEAGAPPPPRDPDVAAPAPPAAATARALPSRLTPLIGRDDVLALLGAKLELHRLVTIVGPGGIGKTTVALAVAERASSRHAHGAVFVDLAPLGDASLVPAALGAALGIPVPAQSPWPTLDTALEARDLLIVLDNCEHVVAAAAALAERVLRAAPRTRVLATSHEPLDAESEAIHRLGSLALPPSTQEPTVAGALAFPALRLFVERATASADDFVLSQANLAAVVRLCRHLDGLPLAIELAAARVGSLGVHALADRLDELFRLLRRSRTTLPRHRTLHALLEWSHGLLDADERTVLHRLSMFRASFTLESAADLASCERIEPARVVACVLGLVSRSLVEREGGDTPRYRLLFVTRIHAAQKLSEAGEAHEIGRRHAACLRDLLARANAELRGDDMTLAAWLAAYSPALSDIRAALAWTDGPQGDKRLGAELVVEAGRLALDLGLHDEFLPRTQDALVALRASPAVPRQLELRLLCLMCMVAAGCITERDIPPETTAQLDELSAGIGTPVEQRTALVALCVDAFRRGDYRRLLARAARFAELPPDPADPSNSDAMSLRRRYRALGAHYLGDHDTAWSDLACVLDRIGPAADGNTPYHQIPVRVSIGIQQARILWLRGRADRARALAFDTLAAAEGKNPFGLSQALALAVVPILLWRGEDAEAASFVDRLADTALRHFQSFWLAWSASYCQVLALRGQDVERLRRRIGAGRNRTPSAMESDMLGTLVAELVGPEQLARVDAGSVGWCAPETWRARAEILLSAPSQRAHAEGLLARSLALARQQGAKAWELRTATTLGALWGATGRRDAAEALLSDVVAGFTEGFDGVDLRRATALLAAWKTVS